jgi:hypothetical protein
LHEKAIRVPPVPGAEPVLIVMMVPALTAKPAVAVQDAAPTVWQLIMPDPGVHVLLSTTGVTLMSRQVTVALTSDHIFMLGVQAAGAITVVAGATVAAAKFIIGLK